MLRFSFNFIVSLSLSYRPTKIEKKWKKWAKCQTPGWHGFMKTFASAADSINSFIGTNWYQWNELVPMASNKTKNIKLIRHRLPYSFCWTLLLWEALKLSGGITTSFQFKTENNVNCFTKYFSLQFPAQNCPLANLNSNWLSIWNLKKLFLKIDNEVRI